jgi:hypothetical protein
MTINQNAVYKMPTAELRFVKQYTYLEKSFEKVIPGTTKLILQQKWIDPTDPEDFQWRVVPTVEVAE